MKRRYYRLIFYYLSVFLCFIGGIQLIPLICLPFYPEEASYAYCFLLPGIISMFVGYLGQFFLKMKETPRLEKNYDSILVVLVWILAILVSACPWMLTGHYNFTQAVFEMTSGYSTTGLTVVDVANCPHIFLLFRSITLFIGGIGLVLILTCALSDKYGLNLYHAEGHSDRLMPNLGRSARVIFAIYGSYIVIGTLAYVLAGMSWFDAINHSIAALAAGGFSTNPESIYGYHSLAIEIISIVLMFLGGTNFMVHFALVRGRFKQVWGHCETKFMVFSFLFVTPFMALLLLASNWSDNFFECLRVSAFQFTSAITGTGFQSVATMNTFPHSFLAIMILLMCIGGMAESTAGGIKQIRIITAAKGLWYSFLEQFGNPKAIRTRTLKKLGGEVELTNEEIKTSVNYLLIYMSFFIVGSFAYTCFGYGIEESMFEFGTSLATVGLSVGIVGYAANPALLWISTAGMFFGRLEIMVIFRAFARLGSDATGRELI